MDQSRQSGKSISVARRRLKTLTAIVMGISMLSLIGAVGYLAHEKVIIIQQLKYVYATSFSIYIKTHFI